MRIAIISDIHSNRVALQAVLADAGAVDETWCLGDVVGYGPEPNECIEILRQREPRLICLAGNHDWAALGRLDTSDFNHDAEAAALWTRNRLTPSSRAYLESLPERVIKGDFTLVHGSPRAPIWEYLISAAVARANFALLTTPYCLVGHSHIPFIFYEAVNRQDLPTVHTASADKMIRLPEQRLFINPGSVGQPRDGNPHASYAILDTGAKTIEHRRVPYSIKETQRLMEQAGLPQRLIQRLEYGL